MNWSTHSLAPFPTHLDLLNSLLQPAAAVVRVARKPESSSAADEHLFYGPRCFIKHGVYAENHVDYFIDPASVLPVVALNAAPGMRTLDLCAAPGGKSLVIGSRALGPTSKLGTEFLVANDSSQARVQRLRQNLNTFYGDTHKAQLAILCTDPARSTAPLAKYGPFDRILIDAPCSSDRHRLAVDAEMKDWTLQNVKRMAKRQKELVAAGSRLLKKDGGRLVYSTCALSELENDGVVEYAIRLGLRPLPAEEVTELMAREVASVNVVELEAPRCSNPEVITVRRTRHGFLVLPCDANAIGPIFWSVLTF